ncbi:hypothetical protein Anas_05169, partial [Armadillidium nasatum]
NLGATFDAFKFPTSDKVQFRAVVTPCIPKCEPVICDVMDFGGQMAQTESYGRRKRSLDALTEYFEQSSMQDIIFVDGNHVDIFAHAKTAGESQIRSGRSRREMEVPEEMLVEQTIKISDKFGFKGEKKSKAKNTSENQNEEYVSEEDMIFTKDVSGVCINTTGLILACSIFLVVQVVLILVWTAIWHRRRNNKLGEPLTHTTTTESLRQLYDSEELASFELRTRPITEDIHKSLPNLHKSLTSFNRSSSRANLWKRSLTRVKTRRRSPIISSSFMTSFEELGSSAGDLQKTRNRQIKTVRQESLYPLEIL